MQFRREYEMILETLSLLKLYSDIGIYDAVVGTTERVNGDDYFEFEMTGLENIAPIFNMWQPGTQPDIYLDEEFIYGDEDNEHLSDGGCDHMLYSFSSPEMREYYRLCRLYEHREGIEIERNPYVKEAEDCFWEYVGLTQGYFGAGFDDDRHTKDILVEVCPENTCYYREIIELIYDTLEFYTMKVKELEREIRLGKPVWLPELPAHESGD